MIIRPYNQIRGKCEENLAIKTIVRTHRVRPFGFYPKK